MTAGAAEGMGGSLALAREQKLFCANAQMAKCGPSQERRGLQVGLAFAESAPMAWVGERFRDKGMLSQLRWWG